MELVVNHGDNGFRGGSSLASGQVHKTSHFTHCAIAKLANDRISCLIYDDVLPIMSKSWPKKFSDS